jgi:serine/threonine-protein kinase
MNDEFVLPEDVCIVPVAELPREVRGQVPGGDGDYAITRPNSRVPSKIVDASGAQFLRQFRTPTTLVKAIREYSRSIAADPHQVLDEALPLIESCLAARLLVEPGQAAAKIVPSFAAGDEIAGHVVERIVQALADSELYRVRMADGRSGALKLARPGAPHMKHLLAREEEILKRLDASVAPALLSGGALEDGRRYLVTEWFESMECPVYAQRLRQAAGTRVEPEMVELCAAILDAYARLHERGIVHSDVHPRNVLVAEDGTVRLIDFGMARVDGPETGGWPRAGIGYFFEPEYASAVLRGEPPPASTFAGEQYALGALLYALITGQHYLDFVFGKDDMLRQIAEEPPVALSRRFAMDSGAVERVLFRALAKDPAGRFPSVGDFARELRKAARELPPVARTGAESTAFVDDLIGTLGRPGEIPAYTGPRAPTVSVTFGAAGIGYALLRIGRAREDRKLLAAADLWSESAAARAGEKNAFYDEGLEITPQSVGCVSPYHTGSGVAVVQALVAHARCDGMAMEEALGRYLDLTSAECAELDVTLGRSSILLGWMLLMEAGGPSPGPHGDALLASIWRELDREPPIRESARVKCLGMAHGWAGLIYTALRWAKLTGTPPRTSLPDRLRQLAELAVATKHGVRWAVQTGADDGFSMAGWCNGGAGHVFLWTLAHRLLREERFLNLAERAGEECFATGGGHSLCCGWAGQAYAQLELYHHTGERRWLEHARQLGARAVALAKCGQPGLPYSLYKGDLGVAVLISELERPETATMPFFAEEGWT